MDFQVVNDISRPQGLLADTGRTVCRTAPALCAGIEIEQLFPGKVADLRDAQVPTLLDALPVLQRALRSRGMEKEVEGGSQYMKVFRIKDIDAESEYDQKVQPPGGPKKDAAAFFQPQVHKEM